MSGGVDIAPPLCYTGAMTKNDDRELTRLMYRAYIRDGSNIHTGEAVLLACLVKTRGVKSKDFKDVQRIMRDVNVK